MADNNNRDTYPLRHVYICNHVLENGSNDFDESCNIWVSLLSSKQSSVYQDPEYDEYCDPNHPIKIKFEGILDASRRMVGFVNKTQCPRANMSEKLGVDLYMKQEFLQFTGCFKERGVRNTMLMLSEDQKRFGVATASSGNHGTAVTFNASELGIPSIVVMPVKAPLTKRNNAERHAKQDGQIILHGKNMAEAKRHAMTLAKEKKMMFINGFDHPNVIEGQGTVGIEIIDQVPNVDAVLVPCGGGSLLCGVAIAVKHLKPDTEIYGIETDKTCSMAEAFKKNKRVFFPIEHSIADGLGVNKVGVNTFFNLKGLLNKMVVVPEDWVARAIMHVIEEEKFNIEGAGAVGIAALMCGLLPQLKGKTVVTIITGGNIDPTTLGRALDRGMAVEGRLVKFKVSLPDQPGALAELCRKLASIGVTMRDCVPERACVGLSVLSIQFKIICETRGWNHTKQMVDLIKKNYKDYLFHDLNGMADKTIKRRHPCLAPIPTCMGK